MIRRTATTLLLFLSLTGCGGVVPIRPAPPVVVQPGPDTPQPSPDAPQPSPEPTQPTTDTPQPTLPAPPPVPDGARREELGQLGGSGYYIDIFSDRLELLAVSAKSDVHTVAAIPVDYPMAQTWTHLRESSLALMVTPYQVGPGGSLYRIDLTTGDVANLGPVVGPTFRMATALSNDSRYLATKLAGFGVPLTIYDLQAGQRLTIDGEVIPMGASWSPTANVAAARAAEPDSGLPVQIGARYVDGATHIDLITPEGAVQHLQPPAKLGLIEGPVWSPDGKWLAVSAGTILAVGQGPDGGSRFEATEIWLVEAATNRWLRLGDTAPGQPLTEWPWQADDLIK